MSSRTPSSIPALSLLTASPSSSNAPTSIAATTLAMIIVVVVFVSIFIIVTYCYFMRKRPSLKDRIARQVNSRGDTDALFELYSISERPTDVTRPSNTSDRSNDSTDNPIRESRESWSTRNSLAGRNSAANAPRDSVSRPSEVTSRLVSAVSNIRKMSSMLYLSPTTKRTAITGPIPTALDSAEISPVIAAPLFASNVTTTASSSSSSKGSGKDLSSGGFLSLTSSSLAKLSLGVGLASASTNPNPTPTTPDSNIWQIDDADKIQWKDIFITESHASLAILGYSGVACVVKAVWRKPDAASHSQYSKLVNGIPVAVKVMSKGLGKDPHSLSLLEMFERGYEEVKTSKRIESQTRSDKNTTKSYGIAVGALPPTFVTILRTSPDAVGVAVVMRYEVGGTLEYFLHSRNTRKEIPVMSKLKILVDVARGLADIHDSGEVHGRLCSANVLSQTSFDIIESDVRLKKFGLHDRKFNVDLSIKKTNPAYTPVFRHRRVYSAPETLVSPFDENSNENTVSPPTRESDIYAFALFCWEVLTQSKPFVTVENETILCQRVHQGYRPDVVKLPDETPEDVVHMMMCCWEKNPQLRRTAAQCLAIFECNYKIMRKARFDIFFITPPMNSQNRFISYVYYRLVNLGYSVQMDRYCADSDIFNKSKYANVDSSKAVIVFADLYYEIDGKCIQDLNDFVTRHASKLATLMLHSSDRSVVRTILGESGNEGGMVQLNLGKFLNDKWDSTDGPSKETLVQLDAALQTLFVFLNTKRCVQTQKK